jgi:hypothetical protein
MATSSAGGGGRISLVRLLWYTLCQLSILLRGKIEPNRQGNSVMPKLASDRAEARDGKAMETTITKAAVRLSLSRRFEVRLKLRNKKANEAH